MLQPAIVACNPAPAGPGPKRINEKFDIEGLQYRRNFDIEVQNFDIRG
jgi:hypothetical protein